MAEKLDSKALKAPDAFQRAGFEARNWLAGRERIVLVVIVGAVLLAGGLTLTHWVSQRSDGKAAIALGDVLRIAERPVGGDASGTEAKPFASELERDEALASGLETFRAQHRGTRAAASAALPLSSAQYRLGRFDDAVASADDYLAKMPKDLPLRAVAIETKGLALEAKKDFAKAADVFEQLARETPKDFMSGAGLFHRARMLLAQGRSSEAADGFREVTLVAAGSAAAQQAKERLEALARQGIRPTAAAAPPLVPVPAPVPAPSSGAPTGGAAAP